MVGRKREEERRENGGKKKCRTRRSGRIQAERGDKRKGQERNE